MISPDSFTDQQLLDFLNRALVLIYGKTSYPAKIEEVRKKD